MKANDALPPDLARRLSEAEATIEALLSGQIDAVVDAKSQTPLLLAKAQDALRQERDRAQRYLDAPEVILLAVDMDRRIKLINRYACSILGWTVDELLGRDWVETCIPHRMRETLIATFDDIVTGRASDGPIENPVVARTGDERLIEWRNTLLRDDAGQVTGVFSCGTDITDRLQAELELRKTTADLVERTKTLEQHAAALRASDERANYALGAAGIGMWELDLTTDQLKWSDSMGPVLGLKPEEAPRTGTAFFAMIHPDDAPLVTDALQKSERDRTDFQMEFRVPSPEGTQWIAGHARLVRDGDDRPVSWRGVNTNISDRKSLEAQFRQSQKMEAIGQLAGGVAHDFNNILTAILGYSNFVIETFGPQDQRRADLEEVITAGQRGAALTRQLLAFSRKQLMQLSVIDLNVLVGGMRPMLSRLIGEQIDIVSLLAANLGLVRADVGQMEQVLMNLVVNARDAMPSGGSVTLETANVELDQSFVRDVEIQIGPYVMLAVSDNGVGMSDATQRRLFEPFFTTKEAGKGTGLGLATVYGIVKQSGGYVWAYSELGTGTTFKVFLPRTTDQETADAYVVGEPAVAAAGFETVLVVEDEDSVRALTRRILETAGYRVYDARNAEHGEALFLQHGDRINLLVTDVIMPGLSGPKLYQRLARGRPDLKVLYASGYTDDTIVARGQFEAGVEFLQKPFTADALTRRVREVLDR